MPANAGNVYQVDLFPIRLLCGFANADTIFTSQLSNSYLLIKFIGITDLNIDHQVLCKFFIGKVLQDKFAAISFKSNIISRVPVNVKTQVLEKSFRCFEIFSGWNEWFK